MRYKKHYPQLHYSTMLPPVFRTDDPSLDWSKIATLLGQDPRSMVREATDFDHVCYADGGCQGNGKANAPGGWGAVIATSAGMTLLWGSGQGVTNNQMELKGAIEALRHVPRSGSVLVRLDSQYVIKGCTEWRKGWQARGMRTAGGGPVLNAALWLELWTLVDAVKPQFKWVRGHVGHPHNELADALATHGTLAARGRR